MNILVIGSNQKAVSLLTSTLKSEFRASAFSCKHTTSAKDYLSDNPLTDLVIVKNINPISKDTNEEAAKIILNFVYDNHLNPKVLVLGELDAVGFEFASLPERFKVSDFVTVVRKTLDISLEQLKELQFGGYFPIEIQNFKIISKSPCDTFIEVNRASGNQYIKTIHAGDEFDKERIKKYEAQGVTELYIPTDQKGVFLESQLKQYLSSLAVEGKSEDALVEMISDAYDINQSLLKNTGVTEQMILMSQASIKSMVKSVTQNKKLSGLLKSILNSKGSFAYKHSYLIIIFSSACMERMQWSDKKQLKEGIECMTFAAFFHDILLTDEIHIKTKNKLEIFQTELNPKERKTLLEHADTTATLISKISQTPKGAEQLIREHHGMRDGIGFSEVNSSNLGVLSIIFIVIEDFVTGLLDFKERKLTTSQILNTMTEKYQIPSYRKVVIALKESLTESF